MKVKSVVIIPLALVTSAIYNVGLAKADDSNFGSWPTQIFDRIRAKKVEAKIDEVAFQNWAANFTAQTFILKDGSIMAYAYGSKYGIITVTKSGVFSTTPIEQGKVIGNGRLHVVKVGDKTYYALVGIVSGVGLSLNTVIESPNNEFSNSVRGVSLSTVLRVEGEVVQSKTVSIPADDVEGQRLAALLKSPPAGEIIDWTKRERQIVLLKAESPYVIGK